MLYFSNLFHHRRPFVPILWEIYIGKNELGDDLEMVVLPICDNAHFNGYVVDIKRKTIMFIDSLYPRLKAGKRSIIQKLRETYFPGVDENCISCTSFVRTKVQFDGSSCGAWLVVGIVAYLLEINSFLLTRQNVFNAMMILVEDISLPEIHERVKNVFLRESLKIDDD